MYKYTQNYKTWYLYSIKWSPHIDEYKPYLEKYIVGNAKWCNMTYYRNSTLNLFKEKTNEIYCNLNKLFYN